MSRVTIRHVAERARVSTSTVSRTLHNHPRISEETKQRVMEAIHELNYRTPLLVERDTLRVLALLIPSSADELFSHPFSSLVMRGVSAYAQRHDYFTLYSFSREEEEQIAHLKRYVESPSVHGVVLLSAHQHDPCIDYLMDASVPFAVVGRPAQPGRVLWVDNDNFHAMYDVVNRLMEKGARRIGFLGGPAGLTVTRDRLEGYRMALSNRGIEILPGFVAHAADFSESAGYRAMAAVLAAGVPDAFVATDDLLGLGALKALADRNIGPLPCVGFNNSRQAREHAPALSSVEIRPEELGGNAARLLIERIEHSEVSENHHIVPTYYVARETTNDTPID